MDKRYMTVSEAGKEYRLSRGMIRKLFDEGHLSGFRTEGGHRRISVASLEQYANRADARADEILASFLDRL